MKQAKILILLCPFKAKYMDVAIVINEGKWYKVGQ